MTRLPLGSITSKRSLNFTHDQNARPRSYWLILANSIKAYTTPGKPASKQPAESYQTLGKTVEDIGRRNELDGEQIAALGEGKVRDVVEGETDEKERVSSKMIWQRILRGTLQG